ncbi:MAG: DUF2169 domain-containing protein [Acidobacteria bacterium]|nr:DUF2169 domain-containing protein [Acidobacteriota bacterium]MCB9398421.1 DUF2169 domain-containing protein [Acidobacteriota bacterium]
MSNFAQLHGVQGQQNVVALKRAYRWTEQGVQQLPAPPEMVAEPVEENGLLKLDTDYFPKRHFTDVIVHGSAWAPAGRPVASLDVAVAINGVARTIRAFGKRTLQRRGTQWSFSEPEPFESIPLHWSEAYGGWDKRGEEARDPYEVEKISKSMGRDMSIVSLARYRRNPHGKGFFQKLTPEHEGAELPRLEWAHDLLTPARVEVNHPYHWYSQPMPANFGFLAYEMFPRSAFWGERMFPIHQDRAAKQVLPEYAFGLKPEDLLPKVEALALSQNPRMFNGAHPALQVPSLRGKVQVDLYHLDPVAQRLSFNVPTGAPQVQIVVPNDSKTYKTEGFLSTLVVDVAKREFCATWHAMVTTKYPTFPDYTDKIKVDVQW